MQRKRELLAEPMQPAKKVRLDRETGRLQQPNPEKKFRKRKLQEVLDELIVRVANNDRQLTNNLIRELDSEHVRVVRHSDFQKSAELMMKACLSAKVDSVASRVFNCLMGIFERGYHEPRQKFILSLEKEADELFSKNNLDEGILKIYTMGIKDGLIRADQIPEKVLLIGRRSLGYSSLSSTASRTASIRFHVAVCISTDHVIPEVSLDVERQLCRLSKDRDFRVRKATSEGLLALANSGYFLAKNTYQTVKMFMKDVDVNVRITAIKLLIYYANRKGSMMEKEMLDEQKDGKPLVSISDDAFSEICDAMNDIEISVRVEAAKTLGDFETVSDDLIDQTLDKKMMRSNAASQVVKVEQSLFALSKKSNQQKDRRWKFAKKAPPKLEEKGGWSRGKELNASCPAEGAKEEEEEESIIPHGACGAFVTALEDEFMDVRKAAVYSLGRLACTRPTFAVSALEYLADMFNDEIADVRLDAINALTPLIAHGQLNSEQLNVILKCLDDAMPDSRQAMRELLKRAQFVDVNCIEMCVRALLACMKRFPKDKEQVYSCMADIGFNHAVQVQSIMRSLLDIHLIFHTRETSIEDQEYVGKLITVLNAASQTPSMVHVMPEFVHRHYRFLRSSFPELVRPIRVLDEQQQCGKVGKSEEKTTEKAEEILKKTYARLCEASSSHQLSDRNLQRDEIFRDTSAISLYNENVSGAARLIFCLGEVSATIDSAAHTVLRGGELGNVKQLIAQATLDMQFVAEQFSGLSHAIHCYLLHCRGFLNFLDMLVWLMQTMASQADIVKAASVVINDVKERVNGLDLSPSLVSFIQSCQSAFFPMGVTSEIDEKRKILTPSTLVALLDKSFPRLPRKLPNIGGIHLKCAKIITPNKDSAVESVLKFFANLPHGIPMEFQLVNMERSELDDVRIRITYPDGKSDLLKPRLDEFKEDGKGFTVNTQAKVTCASSWSEPAEIDIMIGVMSVGGGKDSKTEIFVPLFSSPSSFSPAHVRVRIHPQAR